MIYIILLALTSLGYVTIGLLAKTRLKSHPWIKRGLLAVGALMFVYMSLFVIGLFIPPSTLVNRCIAWHQVNWGQQDSASMCQRLVFNAGPQTRLGTLLANPSPQAAHFTYSTTHISPRQAAYFRTSSAYKQETITWALGFTALLTFGISRTGAFNTIWQRKAVASGLIDTHAAYYKFMRAHMRTSHLICWGVIGCYVLFVLAAPLTLDGSVESSVGLIGCILFEISVASASWMRGREIWVNTKSASSNRRFQHAPPPAPAPRGEHGIAYALDAAKAQAEGFAERDGPPLQGSHSTQQRSVSSSEEIERFLRSLSAAEMAKFAAASEQEKFAIMRRHGIVTG